MMPTEDFPYVNIYTARGKTVAYYRKNGKKVRIQALPGTKEFSGAYARAVMIAEGWVPPLKPGQKQVRVIPVADRNSVSGLIVLYRSSTNFNQLAASTKKDYGREMNMLDRRFGTGAITKADRAWVLQLRDELKHKPTAANHLHAVIRVLWNFAIDRNLATVNPAANIPKMKTRGRHRCFTEDEFLEMSSAKAGAVALPCQIGWHTAQREADILALKWSSYNGETITLRQNKSRRGVQLGREMVVFVPEALRMVLDAQLPPPGEFICLNEEGQRWSLDNFRHRFARVRAERCLPRDLHFHGLRHTHATRLAQAGATDSQIMAVTGHRTRSMVSVYTQEADQAMQAKQALALLYPPKKNPPKRKKNPPNKKPVTHGD